MRNLLCVFIALISSQAFAQTGNSRGWAYIKQTMTGGGTVASSAFSAFNSVMPFKYYALSVDQQGSAGSFVAYLEGSLDNINWTAIGTTNTVGSVMYFPNATPSLYLRVRAAGLGSAKVITATAIGVP